MATIGRRCLVGRSLRSVICQCYIKQTYRPLTTSNTVTHSNAENFPSSPREKTFEELLESSSLMKIRRPQGRVVSGVITNVCNEDLYVDFGGKFQVVVKKPAFNPELYQVGKYVRITLKKFEMTGHFLGQNKHITLLEADGWLMGLDSKKASKS